MADFTKKELIALEDAMENMLLLHPPQNGESPLLNKLQVMIDNYCDHPILESTSNPRCIKCGVYQ